MALLLTSRVNIMPAKVSCGKRRKKKKIYFLRHETGTEGGKEGKRKKEREREEEKGFAGHSLNISLSPLPLANWNSFFSYQGREKKKGGGRGGARLASFSSSLQGAGLVMSSPGKGKKKKGRVGFPK